MYNSTFCLKTVYKKFKVDIIGIQFTLLHTNVSKNLLACEDDS